jgi:hypothetical protein
VTYEQLLACAPKSTEAGDPHAATRFLCILESQLTGEPLKQWTKAQSNYLYKLRVLWRNRAQGTDENWIRYGSRRGPKPNPARMKNELDPTVFGDDDEKDPLLARLESKYGTPLRTDDI